MAYEKCIGQLERAAGRKLTDAEVSSIFERIHRAALDIKAGRAMPDEVTLGKKLDKTLGTGGAGDSFVQEAAQRATMELEHEAALTERRANLQLTKIAARMADADDNKAAGLKDLDAVERVIVRDYSGRTNVESLEQRVAGHKANLLRRLAGTWDALGDDWLGFFQDRQKLLTLVKELRGEDTGDAMAAKGAKAFHDAAEEARVTFNAAGGDVGRLDDWGMPQHHSQEKVARAGEMLGGAKSDDPAVNRQAWVDYMTAKLKGGSRYVDDIGQPWSDTRMREFLGKAWNTIATNGIANLELGERTGKGGAAGRHAESRQIHFQSADDVIDYWNTFGEKTAVEILYGHIDKMAKDIAFVEHFGPNPDVTYQTLRDRALQTATNANPKLTEEMKGRAGKLDALFEYSAGRIKPSSNMTFSAVADGIAHLNSAGKLGGAAIASFFGDKPIYEAVSHLNDIPMMQRWQSELAMLNPMNGADRRLLQQQGLMLESVRSGLNRFYEGLGGGTGVSDFRSTTGKLAGAVMKLTGMDAINEFRKGTFGLNLFASIGNEIAGGKDFAKLADSDVRTLKNYGITESEWNTWKLAKLEQIKVGSASVDNVLTPESIARIDDNALRTAGIIGVQGSAAEASAARRNAMVKLLGAVNTESDFAIVTPGWKERAQFYSGIAGHRGTVMGEIARSALQFKSFPWAYFQRGMDLVANAETPGGKAAMTAWLIGSTTAAGAMIIQTREMLSGKDPRGMMDKDWYKFWGQAFLQGGALGIYGDFLYGINQTRYGSGPLETIAGPTFGPLLELGLVNPLQALAAKVEGKDTHLAAKTVQSVKGFVPGGNIWYTKAAMDHLVWQKVMESLSPGYLANVRQRTLKDFNQDWWWQPGATSPERGPDFERAVR